MTLVVVDIRVCRGSNRSFRTYRLLQVMATNQPSQTLLNRFFKVGLNSCPYSRRNDAQSANRKRLRHSTPRILTETAKLNSRKR